MDSDKDDATSDTDETSPAEPEGREDDGQEYVDRSKIDFDPDDGLYTGTAVEGTSDIPGSTSEDRNDSDDESEGDPDESEGDPDESEGDPDEQSETDPEMADPEPA